MNIRIANEGPGSNPDKPLRVTAALIPSEGRIFIAQRPSHKKFGLLWEFPGGKVEVGETLEESLEREIREELCWKVRVGSLFKKVRYEGDNLRLDLHAFWCTIQGGAFRLREHAAYCWASPGQLKEFHFTEADRELLPLIEGLGALPETPFSTTAV